MNKEEHLLILISEEAGEILEELASSTCRNISKRATKALRFGLNEVNFLEPDGPDNRKRLTDELIDLFAITELMVGAGILSSDWLNREKIEKKKEKVLKMMGRSEKCGTLTE